MRLHIALRRAIALTLCLTLWLSLPLGAGAQAEDDQKGAQDPIVRAIVVEGNVEVDTETILNQVQATKVGEPLDIDGLREDVFRIADLGYFEAIEPELYTVDEDGVRVVFNIVEFPVVPRDHDRRRGKRGRAFEGTGAPRRRDGQSAQCQRVDRELAKASRRFG